MHLLNPSVGEYFPAGQTEQGFTGFTLILPALHVMHAEVLVPVAVRYDPGSHAVQVEAPEKLEYVPALQAVHTVAAARENVPALH